MTVEPLRVIDSYIHQGRIGVLVELELETRSTATSETFRSLVRDLALHIAACAPASVEELLAQPFVKNSSRTVRECITAFATPLRERVAITRFIRWETQDALPPPDAPPGGAAPARRLHRVA